MSKLFERVVYDQLLAHINDFDLLSISQSGFRPGYSIHDVLLCVTESWRRAIDDGLYVGVCFWILRKYSTVLIMRFYFRSLDFMELLVHLISGLQVIFLGGHNGFVIILCYLILEMLQLVYHRVQFWAHYSSPYMLMTSHMLWYLVMFISMLMIP